MLCAVTRIKGGLSPTHLPRYLIGSFSIHVVHGCRAQVLPRPDGSSLAEATVCTCIMCTHVVFMCVGLKTNYPP